jgi:hypothetical protein
MAIEHIKQGEDMWVLLSDSNIRDAKARKVSPPSHRHSLNGHIHSWTMHNPGKARSLQAPTAPFSKQTARTAKVRPGLVPLASSSSSSARADSCMC